MSPLISKHVLKIQKKNKKEKKEKLKTMRFVVKACIGGTDQSISAEINVGVGLRINCTR